MQYQQDCLVIRRELGDKLRMISLCYELAAIAVGQQEWTRAAWLFGAGEVLFRSLRYTPSPDPQEVYAPEIGASRTALGEAAFAAAWAQGQAMTLEQAVTYALEATQERQ